MNQWSKAMKRSILFRHSIPSTNNFTTITPNTSSRSSSSSTILENYHSPSRIPTDQHQLYAFLLKSFIAKRAIEPGKQLHARLHIIGQPYRIDLSTKLVNLYSDCNDLLSARNLFDRIPKRNKFLWNVLIRAYAWNGPYRAAISLFYKMLDHDLVPYVYSFPFVLKACSALSDVTVGRDIHKLASRTQCDTDKFVGAALIDMYAKCGCVKESRQVFDKILDRDAAVWNSMLTCYSHNGHAEECLVLSGEMAYAGVRPTVPTLVTAVSASADTSALPKGRELHGYGWRLGFESQDKVNTALVDMYAKCGVLKVARDIFEQLGDKRVVSWNSMINGYARHGHANEALDLFKQMVEIAHQQPDHITFVAVLSACNHGALLDEGRRIFHSMTRDYHIQPTVQHYTCLIDLLGYFNQLDEAYNLIMEMKVMPDSGVWGSLLNSCKEHKNLELGELALEKLIELEPDDAGNYVILSNLYAQAGRWERVAKLRKLMTERGLKKSTACSWIEVKNKVHTFLSGDTSHSLCDEIYAELERLGGLMAEAGYVPNIAPVFHDVEDDEKTRMILSHSERLAIAFGLISTPPGTKLLINKNIKVCEDCHVAIKYISKITNREIIIRDVNRHHHFSDGICSCGDHW